MGNEEEPLTKPEKTHFAKSGVREILRNQNKEAVRSTGNPSKGLIAIIKPSEKSTYRNLVDILDEMEITGISTYYIVDIIKSDIQKMKARKIY
jgi:hypothetical protein